MFSFHLDRRTRDPLPIQHRARQQAPRRGAQVYAHDNGHRPPLPVPIPVQRDGHSAQPRTRHSTHQPAKRLVQRRRGTRYGNKRLLVEAPRVQDGENNQYGEVRRKENRVGCVIEKWGTE